MISQVILITARLLVVAVEFQGHKLTILSPKVGGPLEVMTVVGVATFSRNSAEAGSFKLTSLTDFFWGRAEHLTSAAL